MLHQVGFPTAFVADQPQPSCTQKLKAVPPPGSRWKSVWEKARPHDFLDCFSHPTTRTPPCLTWAKHMCLRSSLRETIFPLNNAEKKLICQLCCVPSRKGSRDSQVLSTQHLFLTRSAFQTNQEKQGVIKGQSKRCRNLAVSQMKDALFLNESLHTQISSPWFILDTMLF